MALTRRGWSLLGAAAGLLVAARLLGTPELAAFGLASLVLLGLGTLRVRSLHPALAVTREVRPARLHVGGEGRVDLLVTNTWSHSTPVLPVTEALGDSRRAARLLLPRLLPGQGARAAYRVPTTRRGRYSIGPLLVDISDPFGLTHRARRVGAADQITVCPRVRDILPPPDAAGARVAAAESVRAHAPTPEGDEFLTLRDYEVGDDLRKVHWKSTARTGELVIRQDEAWREPQAVVVLDTRPGAHDGQSFECAVESVASVAARLARSGRRFEVVTSAGAILGRSRRGTVALLMDRLAVIQPGGGERLLAAAEDARRRARGALLVVVTGELAPPGTSVLARLAATGAVVLVVTRGDVSTTSTARGRFAVVDGRDATGFPASWNAAVVAGRARHERGREQRDVGRT